MAIMQLTSTNPSLSFMIKKNPSSGMIVRTIRKGVAFGWYFDDQTYNIYFKDADNEISYKKDNEETFEYLNVSRFNTPLFPLNAIAEFLTSALKEKHDLDIEGYAHKITVNLVHIELPHYIELFNKYFDGFTVTIEHEVHKSYSLTVTTNKGLYSLLNFTNLLFLFLAMVGKENIDVSESLVEKYVNQMNVLDAPYFIRYLFVRNILINKNMFRNFKDKLEQTERYDIDFAYGNTAFQRRAQIKQLLPFDKSIVDVGCGEGYYAFPFSKMIEDYSYYAIDIDEEVIKKLHVKMKNRATENIISFLSLQEFLDDYNGESVDVLLSEVIEHMSEEEAEDVITMILENINFASFVITTPNADFNQFYKLDDLRHDDHKWEIGAKKFKEWMETIFSKGNYELEFLDIGDKVNGISTTQGVLVRSKGEN